MSHTEKSSHFAWCALAALALAKQGGNVRSPAQENLFLLRWLATALKQRRFPREVAPDIEWLLKVGRQDGINAQLASKLEYLWRSSTVLSSQTDADRLTFALKAAKEARWSYQHLTAEDWSGHHAIDLNGRVNAIYVLRGSFDNMFNSDGRQTRPLHIRVTGNVAGLADLFGHCGWQMAAEADTGINHLYTLIAEPAGASESDELEPARACG